MNACKLARQTLLHPLDFFYDIQFNGRAKISDAVIVICLAVLARIFNLTESGFSFQTREPYQISVIIDAAWIIIPWLTWAIVNWGVGAIIDGEGKFKDILVSSSFVFIPYILLVIPITILSNILTLKESSIYGTLTSFMYLWMIFLVFVQVKVVQDFELGKTIWIIFLTVVGIFIAWFIGLLIFGLVNQAIQFVIDILKEIGYRT